MAIPEAKYRKWLKNDDLVSGAIPQEGALGINWNIEGDKLGSQVKLELAGPFILEGRSIIQKLCKNNFSWDERIPQDIERQWIKWVHRLFQYVTSH